MGVECVVASGSVLGRSFGGTKWGVGQVQIQVHALFAITHPAS